MSENLNKDVREMKDKDGNLGQCRSFHVRELICKNCNCKFYDTWNRKQIILTDCCILCEGRKP